MAQFIDVQSRPTEHDKIQAPAEARSFMHSVIKTKPRSNGCSATRNREPDHAAFYQGTKEKEQVRCTVEVSHRFESLHAHVKFNNGAVIHPGDEVQVHGTPIVAAFGALIVEDRAATITRANLLERAWVRLTGDFDFMELCEFSFSEEYRV